MAVLAIDIGGTKTAAGIVDAGRVMEHRAWATPSSGGAREILDAVVEQCRPWATDVDVCGVSFGGPFDFATQSCVRSMHVSGWDDLPLSDEVSSALGVPVIADNDANVAALGEYAVRAPADSDPMLYLTVSTGVGAALVVNGRVLRGAHSLAGEIGHLPIGHDRLCNCGHTGCLERAVSGYWIEHDHGQPAVDYLADDARMTEWSGDLARGLWSATLLLDPAVIVIGGGMAAQGARLESHLAAHLDAWARSSMRSAPTVVLGDASGRTVLLGAAVLAEEHAHGSR